MTPMVCKPATRKGEATRDLILDHAYAIAAKDGVEGLSIGELATAVGMSKSGVFAHFGSRQDLQIAVLQAAASRFGEAVLIPALRKPRGLERLGEIVSGWFDWVRDNRTGCLIMGAVSEYDSRPGPLRDIVVAMIERWRGDTARAAMHAIEAGQLRADADPRQLAFEIFGVALALHQDTRLFDPNSARERAERAYAGLIAANLPMSLRRGEQATSSAAASASSEPSSSKLATPRLVSSEPTSSEPASSEPTSSESVSTTASAA